MVAEGGPTGAVWLTLAVTPGFTWGKYARLPLSLTLVRLCLHHPFFEKRAIFTFNCPPTCHLFESVCSSTHTSRGLEGVRAHTVSAGHDANGEG